MRPQTTNTFSCSIRPLARALRALPLLIQVLSCATFRGCNRSHFVASSDCVVRLPTGEGLDNSFDVRGTFLNEVHITDSFIAQPHRSCHSWRAKPWLRRKRRRRLIALSQLFNVTRRVRDGAGE